MDLSLANHTVAAGATQIHSRGWDRQYAGIQALSGIRSPESDLALLFALDHRSSRVRLEALEALIERDDDVVARLAARTAMSDSDWLTRNTGAEALKWVGTRLDVHRLTHMLKADEQWVVRATAADSLGYIAKKAARRALTNAMTGDPHPVVRRDAAFALSYAGDPSVIQEMESALAAETAETEEQARLGLLQGLYALGQYERLAELLSHLQSTDSQVRHATINAIEDDARPEDRTAVIEALRSLVDAESNPGFRADTLRVMAAIRGDSS